MEPGIYKITSEEYHGGKGISNSGISAFKKSPYYYWSQYLDPNKKPKKDNESLNFGSLFHTYVLERELFNNTYIVTPKIDKRYKKGKEEWQSFLRENPNKQFVDESDFELIKTMSEVLETHSYATACLQIGEVETSYFWQEAATDVLCKCRPDVHSVEERVIVDLKTTDEMTERNIRDSIYNYGYNRQAALCVDGISAITQTNPEDYAVVYVYIEKQEPYRVGVFTLSKRAIQSGRESYLKVLPEYKQCLESNYWPRHDDDIIEIDLPKYAYY